MQPHEVGVTEYLANLSIGTIVLISFVLTLVRVLLLQSRTHVARALAETAESFVVAGIFVFLVVRPFFLQAYYIPSESMEPTLCGHEAGHSPAGVYYPTACHDRLFASKISYRFHEPQRGDIIVFRAEAKADRLGRQENTLIKRLIGIPGDEIEIKRDETGELRLFLNGKPQNEPYILEPMQSRDEAIYGTRGPLTLGKGQLFVMGDNRNNSNDSRFWGTLSRDRVIGKAVFVFWPLNRIRFLH